MKKAGHAKRALRKLEGIPLWRNLSPLARKVAAGIIGGLLLLVGIAMIILPGPAVVVIPLALAILGTQFSWPRKVYYKLRGMWKRRRRKHA